MISETKFFGDCHERSIGADFTLHPPYARNYVFKTSASGLKVFTGTVRQPWYFLGKVFVVMNFGPTHSLVVSDGTTDLVTVGVDEAVELYLVGNNSNYIVSWNSIFITGGLSAGISWYPRKLTRLA